MGLLDKFKALLNAEFKSPISLISITVNSNNKTEYHYDEPKKKLTLSVDPRNKEETEKLAPILKEYIDSGKKLLSANTSSLLYRLYDYNKTNPDAQVLEFFKPIISRTDLAALEASLFLRKVFRDGDSVEKLKQDIRNKFGERGSNIANLCTAGYFENFLIPLYNKAGNSEFAKLYELIIHNAVLAVFVHSLMTDSQLEEDIHRKIAISRNYGIKFLHIHGIGEVNVHRIKKLLDKMNKDVVFKFYEKNIFERSGIIIIELLLQFDQSDFFQQT